MKLLLQRISQDETQSIGLLKIIGCGKIREYTTVELPWKDNTPFESCIPNGRYPLKRVDHPDFGKSIFVQNVPGRTGIFIHAANHFHQLKGCIAPGEGFADIDKDGHVDVTNSRKTINALYDMIGDSEAILEVQDAPYVDPFSGKETGRSFGI